MAHTDRQYRLAKEAYRATRPSVLQDSSLEYVAKTPTAVAYRDPRSNVVHIGIRGTHSVEDLITDASLVFNQLSSTSRYRRDKAFVESMQRQFPDSKIELTGHSLGGAVVSALQRELGDAVTSTSFNAAYQPMDFLDRSDRNSTTRVYARNDPLYSTFGAYAPNVVVDPAASGHSLSTFGDGASLGTGYKDLYEGKTVPQLAQTLYRQGVSHFAHLLANTGLPYTAELANTADAALIGGKTRKRVKKAHPDGKIYGSYKDGSDIYKDKKGYYMHVWFPSLKRSEKRYYKFLHKWIDMPGDTAAIKRKRTGHV